MGSTLGCVQLCGFNEPTNSRFFFLNSSSALTQIAVLQIQNFVGAQILFKNASIQKPGVLAFINPDHLPIDS